MQIYDHCKNMFECDPFTKTAPFVGRKTLPGPESKSFFLFFQQTPGKFVDEKR